VHPIAEYSLLPWIPFLPLLGAAFNLLLGRSVSKRLVALVACGTVGVSCAFALYAVAGPLYHNFDLARRNDEAVTPLVSNVYTWIASGNFVIPFKLFLDPLNGVMIVTVTFVGFLIHVYSIGYMGHDPRFSTYFGYLNLFTGAMLILVLASNLVVMFIGWEGVGLCSYLLIGFWFDKEKNANAGRKAFVVNRIGDFCFLIGIFILWSVLSSRGVTSMDLFSTCPGGPETCTGLTSSSGLAALRETPLHGWGMPTAFWVGLFLFGGAIGKSAQIPLYVWLPDAMAGPTPVSALIHAATMVTAGVYMVARMAFMYHLAPGALAVVAGVGAATALFAAIIGFAQTDIKRVLAYSTVSQLGFMFVGVGVGAYSAGIFHLFTHAFFKAGLFLAAGSVMHAMGDRTDIMKMGGLRRLTPITHAVFLVYCLAIAGIFPFSGFFSKDDILLAAFTAVHGWPLWYGKLLWLVLTVAALGTAFYMWRLYFLVFWGESRADEETKHHIHESPRVMTGPLVVLAVGAALLGLIGLPGKASFIAQWVHQTNPTAMPEEAHPAGLIVGLMLVALVLALIGIGAAYRLYRDGPEGAAPVVARIRGLYRATANAFYVDQFYDLVFVRGMRAVWNGIYQFVDRILIDGILVGIWSAVTSLAGRVALVWQNGDVQRYLGVMVLGAAAIYFFTSTTCVRGPDFDTIVEPDGTVRVTADFRGGVARDVSSQHTSWDFDGDRQPDATGETASFTYATPGKHEITMTVKDVWDDTKVVRHTVQVKSVTRREGGSR
jgi:NADH-quinone oxidoreductase subunit L